MTNELSLLVDTEFVKKLYEITGKQVPETIELADLKNMLNMIESRLKIAEIDSNSNSSQKKTAVIENQDGSVKAKSVLVIDDLGIVTIQLQNLFKRLGFNVVTSRELYDAIEKYKTQDFDYAIIDLFIPTEREGFILIDEIKKLSLLCKLNTKIAVMSASNKKEHHTQSINKGADIFIEKTMGWQEKIVDFCLKEKN